jgi:glycosyltransferase involved in cell wall biosynthesis
VTLFKDVRKVHQARTSALGAGIGPWKDTPVRFVWQRHSLFRADGKALSKALGVPLVLSVHAMQVEEAASWGVARPGWSRLTEHFGEVTQLRAADLIVCVSDAVAESVARRGIADSRILVTPNGVDATHFRPREDRAVIRNELGIGDKFVVGWCGSFRRFHGLDLALEAMALLRESVPHAVLLLIGDGQDLARLDRRVREMNLTNVQFTGTVSHDDMPGYLSACDAGLVLSPPHGPFHYSPVKLREYMACGLPVIAHAVGELKTSLTDSTDAMMIPPDDVGALVGAIQRLAGDSELRVGLAKRGTHLALSRWSWSAQVSRVLEALESRDHSSDS